MAVRTKQLALATMSSVGSSELLYTVPDGYTLLLRQISTYNSGSVATEINYACVVSGPLYSVLRILGSLATAELDDYQTWAVLEEGQQIYFFTSAAQCQVMLSGALLSGIAPP